MRGKVLQILLRTVRVRFDPNPGASLKTLTLDPSGYTITLNATLWNQLSDDEKLKALLHEVSHILRGDLLIGKEFDPTLVTIATDSIINTSNKINDEDQWTYDKVRKYCPELPEQYLPCWRQIYSALTQRNPAPKESKTCNIILGDLDDAIRSVHISTVLRLRQELKSVVSELPTSLREAVAGSIGIYKKSDPLPPVKPIPAWLKKLVTTPERFAGELQVTRSWAREHPGGIAVRGILKRPSLKVLVAVDCSGSVLPVLNTIRGAAQFLQSTYNVDVIYFSDTISSRPENVLGGGTLLMPVTQEAVQRSVSLLAVVTDGQYFDREPALACLKKNHITLEEILIGK